LPPVAGGNGFFDQQTGGLAGGGRLGKPNERIFADVAYPHVRQHQLSHVCLPFFNITTPKTTFSKAIVKNTKAMFGVGDFANQIAEPAKQSAAKKLMPAPSFLFLMGVAFINVCALMLPNR